MTQDLLTIADVAKLAGVKPASIKRYHQTGRMPPPDCTFSLVPVWKRATIDAWLPARRRRGRPRASSAKPVTRRLHSLNGEGDCRYCGEREPEEGSECQPKLDWSKRTQELEGIISVWPPRTPVSSTEPVDDWTAEDYEADHPPVVCTTPCGRCLPTSTETGVKRCRWEGAEYVEP